MRRLLYLLVPLLVTAGAPGAQATEDDPTDGPSGSNPRGGSVLLLLDASEEMARDDEASEELLSTARSAIDEMVQELPDDVPVGLRLYGHDYTGDEEALGCRDTELVAPVDEAGANAERIRSALESVEPAGWAPVGRALTSAEDDLPDEGPRQVVVIGGAEDPCDEPSACEAAETLGDGGPAVRVDTVGLDLDEDARDQFECIAEVGGGAHHPAEDAEELEEQLRTITERAVQRFGLSGAEIDGGSSETGATAIDPNQEYVDDVRDGRSRWYAVQVPAGHTPALTVVEDGSVEYGCCLVVRWYDEDSERVASDTGYNTSGEEKTYTAEPADSPEQDATYRAEVWLDAGDADGALPYRLTVGLPEDATLTEDADPGETEPTAGAEETEGATRPDGSAGGDSGRDLGFRLILLALVLLVLIVGSTVVSLVGRSAVRRRPGDGHGADGQ